MLMILSGTSSIFQSLTRFDFVSWFHWKTVSRIPALQPTLKPPSCFFSIMKHNKFLASAAPRSTPSVATRTRSPTLRLFMTFLFFRNIFEACLICPLLAVFLASPISSNLSLTTLASSFVVVVGSSSSS